MHSNLSELNSMLFSLALSLETFIKLLQAWCRKQQGRLADGDCGLCAVCQVVLSEAGLAREEGGALEGILAAAAAAEAGAEDVQDGVVRMLPEVARGAEAAEEAEKRDREEVDPSAKARGAAAAEEVEKRDREEVDPSAKARRDMEGTME
jgi:hypothetical protein